MTRPLLRRTRAAAVASLLVCGVAGLVSLAGAPSAAAAGTGSAAPLVLIGADGLSWSDVSEDATPMLWTLLSTGASSTLTVRSVHANTCPVDGWLSLSAGVRAADTDSSADPSNARPPCRAIPSAVGSGQVVPGWTAYQQAASRAGFGSSIGLLGDAVSAAGRCVQAVGPGAALGAARSSGVVDRYAPLSASAASMTRCPVTLVDVGAVRDPADVDPADAVKPAQSRAAQVRAMDTRIATVIAAAPDNADIVVASLADAGRSERLRLLVASGPDYPAGTLRSSSTRQPGLVQSPDLTATVLSHLGIEVPDALGGSALSVVPAQSQTSAATSDRQQSLVDLDLASHEVHSVVSPFFKTLVIAQLVVYVLALILWRRRWGSEPNRRRLLQLVRIVATVAATVPVSTFLANLLPWWRASSPAAAVTGSVAIFVVVLSVLALLGPWRRWLLGPPAVICVATMLVLAADVMTGSRLQLSSLLGLQPVVGGRFYGMGNVTFAVFATAALLLCVAAAELWTARGRRRSAAVAVVVVGLVALAVDASPAWGSDFGGPPALLPALALVLLATLKVRVTLRRVVAIVGGTVAFLVLVSVADWLRPAASQSHLGRFVQTVIDGGAWEVIRRKLEQNLSIVFHGTLSLLVPVALLVVIAMLSRPTSWGSRALARTYVRAPLLRPGLIALLVMYVIGFALNDSGAAIPAVGAALAAPLVIAVAVKALEDEVAPAVPVRRTRPAPQTAVRPKKGSRRTSGSSAGPGSPGAPWW